MTTAAAIATTRPPPMPGSDSWLPVPARIRAVQQENYNTRTFRLEIIDPVLRSGYRWAPGQFNMLYAPGVGEAAISISSDPDEPHVLEHTIRIVGSVTRAIDRLGQQGGLAGLRGPFGRGWPMELIQGQDVILLAGGIGLAPLRPMIYWLLRHRERCRRLVLLFGCRSPEDRLFVPDLNAWSADRSIDLLVTVDNATGEWSGPVGVVTNLLKRIKIDAARTLVMVCGPRILNRVAAWNFLQLHVPTPRIYVSLERNMNCGFGHCGHCQYGSKFVCTDGPVFRFDEIADIFGTEEI
jgi:NAD(P)H-flavin reductase